MVLINFVGEWEDDLHGKDGAAMAGLGLGRMIIEDASWDAVSLTFLSSLSRSESSSSVKFIAKIIQIVQCI